MPTAGRTGSGARFTDRVLPLWSDVLALAVEVHHSLADGPFLCQDVALTGTGSMIIVLNHKWRIGLIQKPFGSGLEATPFADLALAGMAGVAR